MTKVIKQKNVQSQHIVNQQNHLNYIQKKKQQILNSKNESVGKIYKKAMKQKSRQKSKSQLFHIKGLKKSDSTKFVRHKYQPKDSINYKEKPIVQNKRRQKSLQQINKSSVNKLTNSIVRKIQQKQTGLILHFPQNEQVIVKPLQFLDEVIDKYVEMINNDNETAYIMNALPQLLQVKKNQKINDKDLTGKLSKLSQLFQNLTSQKLQSLLKRLPIYCHHTKSQQQQTQKLILISKHRVNLQIGFLQYWYNEDKMTIFRIYISKIYRKTNYLAFTYLQILKLFYDKFRYLQKFTIIVLERNFNVHKFFKFLGFKIEKVITQTKNKNIQYFHEFTIKNNQLQEVLNIFLKKH